MYSDFSQNDFRLLRDSQEKATRSIQSLQPLWQLISGHPPADATPTGGPIFPFSIDQVDATLYGTEMPFWMDSFADLQGTKGGSE
jgi:hypothetical protein